MPRMRTASKAYRLILEQDPDSEITLHYIRHLIASGAVPVIHVGRKSWSMWTSCSLTLPPAMRLRLPPTPPSDMEN